MSTLVTLARHSTLSLLMYLTARAANVIVFIIVGRSAGPEQAGVLSLALTYLLIFSVLTRGLDELVTRQAARVPRQARHYLSNFALLRLILAVTLYLILLGVIHLIEYPVLTRQTIALMGLSIVPDSVGAVGQAILIGQRRFGLPALAAGVVSLIRVIGGVGVLVWGGDVRYLAVVWGLGGVAGMVLLLAAAHLSVGPSNGQARWDPAFLARHVRPALPFLFISFLLATEFQLDVILLSLFHGEAQVGWYSAATTVTATVATLAHAYRMALYPLMTRYAARSPDQAAQLYHRSLRALGIIVLPLVVGLVLLAPQIVVLLFGKDFEPTGAVLQVLAWSLICVFLNVPNTRLMYVNDRQSRTTLFLVGSMATNVFLNLALDGPLGAQGAALARVASSLVFFWLGYRYISRHLLSIRLFRSIYKAALAALAMAAVVWLVRPWSWLLSIPVGALAYGGFLLALGGIPPEDLALMRQAIAGIRWFGSGRAA